MGAGSEKDRVSKIGPKGSLTPSFFPSYRSYSTKIFQDKAERANKLQENLIFQATMDVNTICISAGMCTHNQQKFMLANEASH